LEKSSTVNSTFRFIDLYDYKVGNTGITGLA